MNAAGASTTARQAHIYDYYDTIDISEGREEQTVPQQQQPWPRACEASAAAAAAALFFVSTVPTRTPMCRRPTGAGGTTADRARLEYQIETSIVDTRHYNRPRPNERSTVLAGSAFRRIQLLWCLKAPATMFICMPLSARIVDRFPRQRSRRQAA